MKKIVLGAFAFALAGCGGDGSTGSLSVLLQAEDTILDGLDPGTDASDISDGWTVRWNRYIVAIGAVDAHLAEDDHVEVHGDEVFVVDLGQVPQSGLSFWSLPNLETGRWNISYQTPKAVMGEAQQHASVSDSDFTTMVANEATYLISWVISDDAGQSCPPLGVATPGGAVTNGQQNGRSEPCYDNPSIEGTFLVQAATTYGPCSVDGALGVGVSAGGQTVALTIHGDHLFFNGFPEGDEGGIVRGAQWLADSDLNLDGTVTQAELESLTPSDLTAMDGFQLGGSPITPLEDLWDYVTAQLKTQGHFQGEGECPADGVEHDHDHE